MNRTAWLASVIALLASSPSFAQMGGMGGGMGGAMGGMGGGMGGQQAMQAMMFRAIPPPPRASQTSPDPPRSKWRVARS